MNYPHASPYPKKEMLQLQHMKLKYIFGFVVALALISNPFFSAAANSHANNTQYSQLNTAQEILLDIQATLRGEGEVRGAYDQQNLQMALESMEKTDMRIQLMQLKYMLQSLVAQISNQSINLSSLSDDAAQLEETALDVQDYVSLTDAGMAKDSADQFLALSRVLSEVIQKNSSSVFNSNLQKTKDTATRLQERIREARNEGTTPDVDTLLKISESSDGNNSYIIQIENDEVSDEFGIFTFDLEAEKDISLNKIRVEVESNLETEDFRNMLDSAYLEVDGERMRLSGYASGSGGKFDGSLHSLDFKDAPEIAAGDEVEATLFVEFGPQSSFPRNAKIQAYITPEQMDHNHDEYTGEELGERVVGQATGNIYNLRTNGIVAEVTGADADSDNGTGTFEIEFDVTAIEDDQYISHVEPVILDDDGEKVYEYSRVHRENVDCNIESTSIPDRDRTKGDGLYPVEDGETEEFIAVCKFTPEESGEYEMHIEKIGYSQEWVGSYESDELEVSSDWRTRSILVRTSGDMQESDPHISDFSFSESEVVLSSDDNNLELNVAIDDINDSDRARLSIECDDGLAWMMKVYGNECGSSIALPVDSMDRTTFHGDVNSELGYTLRENPGEITAKLEILETENGDPTNRVIDSAETTVEVGDVKPEIDLDLEPNRDGYRAGYRADWEITNDAQEWKIEEYRVTIYRQDANGSAETTHTTKGTTGSRLNYNAGESRGYCYYFDVTVEGLYDGNVVAEDNEDICVMAKEENEPGNNPAKG